MPFKHSWSDYDKRGSGDQRYAKYDNQLFVIVAQPTAREDGSVPAPNTIYLSALCMTLLGDPTYISVVKDGDYIGFRATLEEDPKAYVVNRPKKTSQEAGKEVQVTAGRPFLSARSVIKKWHLRAGAYTADKDVMGADIIIYFNSKQEPSKV